VLHDRIAQRFGYPLAAPPSKATALQKELLSGVTVDCGSSMSVKAAIFDWSMTKGIRREEYPTSLYHACAGLPMIKNSAPAAITTEPSIDFVGDWASIPWKKSKACHGRCLFTHSVTNETMTAVDLSRDHRVFGARVFRYTGMLMITKPGHYTFDIFSANGAGWFGLDGSSLGEALENGGYKGRACWYHNELGKDSVDLEACVAKTKKCRGQITRTLDLSVGPHSVEAIFMYRITRTPGVVKMNYSGPDTNYRSKIMDSLVTPSTKSTALGNTLDDAKTPAGFFAFDSSNQLAIMPAGSCDLECLMGLRKERAAVYRLFCDVTSQVLFEAEVSGTMEIMFWLDDKPVQVMTLGNGTDDVTSVRSANFTQIFEVGGGAHALAIQGRPSAFKAMGFKSLRMAAGGEKCKFLVSGTRSLGSETGKQLCTSS